jgi:predicted nuclease with TOPRIM domain
MSRYLDQAPVGATCPIIDSVIAFIDSIDCEDISTNTLKDYINKLEQVRSANDLLRGWGNGLYEQNEKLEEEKSDMENKLSRMENEIYDLRKEIASLEKELSLT